MLDKLLSSLIGFVGVTLLFWLGLVYDRLPAGWPNTSIALPLGIHWTFHMPWAGAVTAAEAKYAALQAQEAAAAKHAKVVEARQDTVSRDAQAQQVVIQTRIHTTTRTLIQQVPYAVPPSADPLLPSGWVRLHDAGALGLPSVPPAAPGADAAPSAAHASDALEAVLRNYGAANGCRAELIGLQDWVRRQAEAQR